MVVIHNQSKLLSLRSEEVVLLITRSALGLSCS